MALPGEQVHSYGFLVYGSQSGYQNSRAQIQLSGSSPQQTVGFIWFCDPDRHIQQQHCYDVSADVHVRADADSAPN